MKLNIVLGAMAPSLKEQLKPFKFKAPVVRRWDKIADATSLMYIHGYISPSVVDQARKRLIKEIQKAITNKEKA